MIIAVSDLHLGDTAANKRGFTSFIEGYLKPKSDEITDLVLLGDILDLWRRDSSTVIFDHLNLMNELCAIGFHVHYIVGNHDFMMTDFGSEKDDEGILEDLTCNPNNVTVRYEHVLANGGNKFRFIHGHQMSYWYALPFYEAFSRAMCSVNEDVKELSNVWTIFQRQMQSNSPLIVERIQNLSLEQREKIDKKLAGPLVGHSIPVEQSLVDDYNLLKEFIEFNEFQSTRVGPIVNEISSLHITSETLAKIENLVDLGKLTKESPFEEVASSFLNAWIGINQWSASNRESQNEEIAKLARQFKRIALMFSTNLERDEFLIHGHGHSKYVDQEIRIADAGCWIEDKASFIKIEEGNVSCNPWPRL